MAMGKRAVNALGGTVAAVLVAGGCLGVALPILNGNAKAEKELSSSREISSTYTKQLTRLSSGEQNSQNQQLEESIAKFKSLVPGSIDIESASRAIASALPEGVKLNSFNFGTAQAVTSLDATAPSLSGFTPPTSFGDSAADAAASTSSSSSSSSSTSTSSEADAAKSAAADTSTTTAESGTDSTAKASSTEGFTQIPFTIEVSAGSYDELAQYINSLSNQPRLMSVVSVSSEKSDTVTAKVYAFAFVNS